MLLKFTLFSYNQKNSFYTNCRIEDAGAQTEKGSKGRGRRWQTPAIEKIVP